MLTRLIVSLGAGVVVAAVIARRPARPQSTGVPRSRSAESWLRQAGCPLTLGQLAMLSAAIALTVHTILTAWTDSALLAAAPAAVAAATPHAYFRRQHAQRMDTLAEAWPEALRDLSASLSSGRSLPQALSSMRTAAPAALRPHFQHFAGHHNMSGVAAALETMRAELADPVSDRVVEVLLLAHQQGGDVVPRVLDALARDVRQDVLARQQIRTLQMDARTNGRAALVMPWAVLLLLTLRDGPFREFYASPSGGPVLLLGAVMSLIGGTVLTRMARLPAEPRVFTGDRPR